MNYVLLNNTPKVWKAPLISCAKNWIWTASTANRCSTPIKTSSRLPTNRPSIAATLGNPRSWSKSSSGAICSTKCWSPLRCCSSSASCSTSCQGGFWVSSRRCGGSCRLCGQQQQRPRCPTPTKWTWNCKRHQAVTAFISHRSQRWNSSTNWKRDASATPPCFRVFFARANVGSIRHDFAPLSSRCKLAQCHYDCSQTITWEWTTEYEAKHS